MSINSASFRGHVLKVMKKEKNEISIPNGSNAYDYITALWNQGQLILLKMAPRPHRKTNLRFYRQYRATLCTHHSTCVGLEVNSALLRNSVTVK